ncbi:hypothetical protein GPECTOR_1g101 [Gonium pectorale]|uniref:Uncharacterized protein n=1 Tax=Gonium pectorale TaxID=33097 RepID=A0A150H1Z4_GONPE|nr:hypothetical protein GPECTOR_1g101 [Gonium pectorale]|eukprot:KXZ56121.1 hypothetical protein GPECTOR_1g101 [Gonium pectorale]
MASQVLYAAEPLVDLLVRCRCHHYLEFKAVEGSYLMQDGRLQAVPAGKADIFRDRRLGLADKRALMRFIQGCAEARAGQGHVQAALSSSRPFAEVLATEGLSPRLREVILYGIAMCDIDQEPPSQPSPPNPADGAAAAATASGSPTASGDGAATEPAAVGGSVTSTAADATMGSSQGAAVLDLFTSSQGRFGQEGAFMLPSYGCGSVSEAFVRLCAVHGAVTVLRQPVQALLVGDAAAAAASAAAAAAAKAAEAAPPGTEGEAKAETTGSAASEAGAERTSGEANGGASGTEAAPAAEAAADGGRGRSESGEFCVGLVTAAGQVVRCGAVVAGAGTLRGLEGVGSAPPPERVSRAVVVLDGPLVGRESAPQQAAAASTSARPQAPPSLLTLVVPPRSGGSGGPGGPDLGNPHPVRGLQMSSSTCVCPAGKFLLYLSTPSTSACAHEDLWPALAALVDVSQLREPGSGAATANPASSAAPTPSTDSGDATSAPAAPSASSAVTAAPAAATAAVQPRALRAWFYQQPVLQGHAAALAGRLPGGVVAVPGADGGLVGYVEVLRATEEVHRAAFPGVPWLGEADFSEKGHGSGGDGDAAGAAAYDPGEEDAIDELTAALARLKGAVYIHVGPFTEDRLQRFSTGLLQNFVGGPGPGVKPSGALHWVNHVANPEQEVVMIAALEFMQDTMPQM